jgi:outer membrane protein assembly factor BamB
MRIVSLFSLLLISGALLAADWPGWRGPDGTGISAEKGLMKTWPKDGLKPVWKTDKAGRGYAGMAVVKGVVYTMGARGKDEYVLAFDAKGDGKEKWARKVGPVYDYSANSWSYGPNATPAVDGDKVYALSSKGMLMCVSQKDGTEVWKVDLFGKLEGRVHPASGGDDKLGFGYGWSPVIDGDVVVALPGGAKGLFATFDKKTGDEKWRSKEVTDPATYASAVVATIGGVKQYIAVVQSGVVAVAAKDGKLLWRHKREDDYPQYVVPTPVVSKDRVYVSVGSAGGLDCLKVSAAEGKFKVKAEWTTKRSLNNLQGGVVLVGNHLYGYHENRKWACVDVTKKGGPDVWKKPTPALKAGGFVVADGRLYVLDDQGLVAMVEATPKEFKLISSFELPAQSKQRMPRGAVWTHPSLSDGKLYVRDQELIFCYDVKGK